MIKLRFNEKEIKTFQDGRVTKCYIWCQIIATETGNVLDSFKVTGKAVCNPKDQLDPKLGAALADSRARHKAFARAYKVVNKFIRDMRMYDLINFHSKVKYLLQEEQEHEARLLKGI